jgi:hypothetical protein
VAGSIHVEKGMTGTPRSAVRIGTCFTAGLLLLSGCTSTGNESGTSTRRDDRAGPPAAGAIRLVAFDSCDDLIKGLRKAGRDSVGPYGFPGDRHFVAGATGAERVVPQDGARQAAPGADGPAFGAPAPTPTRPASTSLTWSRPTAGAS